MTKRVRVRYQQAGDKAKEGRFCALNMEGGEDVPIKRVKEGFKFGKHGKVYKSKAKALKQAKAIFVRGNR